MQLPAAAQLRRLTAYDAQGGPQRVALTGATGRQQEFSTADWKPGVYLLRMELTNGQVVQQKLIKE